MRAGATIDSDDRKTDGIMKHRIVIKSKRGRTYTITAQSAELRDSWYKAFVTARNSAQRPEDMKKVCVEQRISFAQHCGSFFAHNRIGKTMIRNVKLA